MNQYAPITVDGHTYDCDAVSHTKMLGSVLSWDALMTDPILLEKGAVTGVEVVWVLTDDTKVLVTKEQLQAVIDAIAVRAGKEQLGYSEVKDESIRI